MAVKAVLPSAMLTLFAFARLGEAQVQDPIYIDTYQAYEFGAGQVINFDAGTGQPAYMLDQVRFGVYLRIRRKNRNDQVQISDLPFSCALFRSRRHSIAD